MKPFTLYGRDRTRQCHIENPLFLAPMEGVTDMGFRHSIGELGSMQHGVGIMSTQFIRISDAALPMKVFAREIGERVEPCPLIVQLMASDTPYVAEAVAAIERTRAACVDFNFGCPVKRVFNKQAGSAMLAFPQRMHNIIATAVAATTLPVSAKIRAGIEDIHLLTDNLHALADAGVTMICLHARLRIEAYSMPAHWDWIAQAVDILRTYTQRKGMPTIPLIGNGAVDTAADIDAMLAQTQCAGVMIGRAALTNPFIFRQYMQGAALAVSSTTSSTTSATDITPTDAAAFIASYWQQLRVGATGGGSKGGLGKMKQLLKYYQAGNLLSDEQRNLILRSKTIEPLQACLQPLLGDDWAMER